jgi:hypothetical protein
MFLLQLNWSSPLFVTQFRPNTCLFFCTTSSEALVHWLLWLKHNGSKRINFEINYLCVRNSKAINFIMKWLFHGAGTWQSSSCEVIPHIVSLYGSRRFNIMLTSDHDWALPWDSQIQSSIFQIYFNIILSCTKNSRSGFLIPSKILYASTIPMCATYYTHSNYFLLSFSIFYGSVKWK